MKQKTSVVVVVAPVKRRKEAEERPSGTLFFFFFFFFSTYTLEWNGQQRNKPKEKGLFVGPARLSRTRRLSSMKNRLSLALLVNPTVPGRAAPLCRYLNHAGSFRQSAIRQAFLPPSLPTLSYPSTSSWIPQLMPRKKKKRRKGWGGKSPGSSRCSRWDSLSLSS